MILNKKSTGKIDDLKLPPNTRKCYVVVTPEGVRPTITVATKYPQNEEQQEKTSDDEETSTNEDEESTDGDREMSVLNELEENPESVLEVAFCQQSVTKATSYIYRTYHLGLICSSGDSLSPF